MAFVGIAPLLVKINHPFITTVVQILKHLGGPGSAVSGAVGGGGGVPPNLAAMTPAQRAFLAADSDRDGKVSRSEYAAYQTGFAAADTDGDGLISQVRIVYFVKDTYYSAVSEWAPSQGVAVL